MTKQKNLQAKKNVEFSKSKKIIFWITLLLIPILFFVLLEIILRYNNYGENTKLFVDTLDKEQKIYYNLNVNVAKRYFSYSDFVPTPRVNLFLKNKPENSYRIFVMGGSTAAGYPYGNNVDFGKILHRRLIRTFPNKKIELINCAMTAINSYTILDFMNGVIEQKPDLILMYAGHNEFYGAMGVASMESLGKYPFIVKSYLKMQRFKTIIFLRDIIANIYKLFVSDKSVKDIKEEETAMAKLAKDQLVELNSDDYKYGKIQFKENISEIIQVAKKNNIKIILSELVSNIKDLEPFLKNSKASELYEKGSMALNNGEFEKAKKIYYEAKDLDAIRFRAPEDFNRILNELSDEYDVPLVPMKTVFEQKSEYGIIGYNLMHEHLHPNKEGYFLMADAFYNTIKSNNLIHNNWPKNINIDPSNWGFTDLDSIYAEMSITHLMGDWPFTTTGEENNALDKYPKTNYVDSLAFKLHVNANLTLEWGHLELGRYYESIGEYRKALDEYLAIIYLLPNADAFYEPAVKLLSKTRNYRYALNLLFEGLRFHKSPLMYSWIGQFSSAIKEYEQAIKYLEMGLKDRKNDILALYSLAKSYYHVGKFNEGDQITKTIQLINPNSDQVSQLKNLRNSLLN